MEIVRKLNYIFSREQKIKLALLFVMIVVGTFAELFGVTSILPIIQVATEPGAEHQNLLIGLCIRLFHCTETAELLFALAFVILVIFVVKNVYIVFMYAMQYKFIFNNQYRLASRLMSAYIRKPYVFHLSKNSAELQRNINVDTNQFFAVVLNSLQIVIDIMLIAVLFIYLIFTDVTMTLVSMTFVLGFMAAYYVFSKKKIRILGDQGHDAYARMIQYANQSFDGIKEIKVSGKERFFEKAYADEYYKYMQANKKQNIYTSIPKYLLETVAIGGIMLVIMVKAYSGEDLASLVSNLSVFAVAVFKLVPSANRINGSINGVLFQLPSVDTIYRDLHEIEDMEKEPSTNEGKAAADIKFEKELTVEKLWYRYPGSEKYVLEDAALQIPKGCAAAFVGESGSGKTTLADIILGVLKPERGEILADGVNINTNLKGWQKKLGYIPQNIFLLDDTIRKNILFGVEEKDADEEAVWRAVEQAQLKEYILGLEDGLDTVVGERGVRMSGGQRQRLGIARALYHDPELLVMDEATSALDHETEQAVMEAIEALYGTKTLIIIAHRLSTIEKCDLIYEVADKKVKRKNSG